MDTLTQQKKPAESAARAPKRIAVVTMGVKLGDETRGYTRFRFLSELLAREGFAVDLVTSTFQHWEKAQRDCSKPCYQGLPYRIVFIEEPGYTKNLDLGRIRSHRVAAKNLREHFAKNAGAYDLVYAEIPPNDVARVCAEAAEAQGIPFVADINDLWPEAMRMVVDIPVVSDVAFYPFARDAKRVYQLLSGAVVWVTYAGTLGASYDVATLVRAAALLEQERLVRTGAPAGPAGQAIPPVRVKVLGDGPDREKLQALAAELDAPADFLGYQDYEHMAAYLCASDIVVNSLVKSAAQSIVTKIGDYLASGKPMVNTGSSPEFRSKVSADGFGMNVEAEDPRALADEIAKLAGHASLRKIMGAKGRAVAEREFDQPRSYRAIVDLLRTLL